MLLRTEVPGDCLWTRGGDAMIGVADEVRGLTVKAFWGAREGVDLNTERW